MSSINATSFDDLAQQCVMSDFKHRMLYLFLRVGAAEGFVPTDGDHHDDDEAMMVQVLFDAHQPAVHGMTFQAIRQTADAQNTDWNMVAVGIAKNLDASLPTDAQAHSFLAEMREKIMIGAINGYALLDREGNLVDEETQVVPLEGRAALN